LVSAGSIRLRAGLPTVGGFPAKCRPAPCPIASGWRHRNLIRADRKTRFAISTEETRFYLNGIYLHAAKDGKSPCLRAVATDGHRLARYELDLPEGAKDIPGVIVPRKTRGRIAPAARGRRECRRESGLPLPRSAVHFRRPWS